MPCHSLTVSLAFVWCTLPAQDRNEVIRDHELICATVTGSSSMAAPTPTQLCISAVRVPFEPSRATALGHGAAGVRPFADLGWMTCDTFSRLQIGKAKLKAGHYLLTLHRVDGGLELQWFDAAEINRAGLQPRDLTRQRPLARLPLTERNSDGNAAALSLRFVAGQKHSAVTFRLGYGNRVWAAELGVDDINSDPLLQWEERRACTWRPAGGCRFARLDHGEVIWSEALSHAAGSLAAGARWRLGANWWTTLQTSHALQLGGTTLPAGVHLLSLERTADGCNLLVHDAALAATKRIDARRCADAAVRFRVPLRADPAADPGRRLRVHWQTDDAGAVHLAIAIGPHHHQVPVAMQ